MTGIDLGGLNDVIRDHHHTGVHRGCIIRVHPDVLGDIRATCPPVPARRPWESAPALLFGGLDLVRDESLPARSWALVRVEYAEEPPPVWVRRVETTVRTGTTG